MVTDFQTIGREQARRRSTVEVQRDIRILFLYFVAAVIFRNLQFYSYVAHLI